MKLWTDSYSLCILVAEMSIDVSMLTSSHLSTSRGYSPKVDKNLFPWCSECLFRAGTAKRSASWANQLMAATACGQFICTFYMCVSTKCTMLILKIFADMSSDFSFFFSLILKFKPEFWVQSQAWSKIVHCPLYSGKHTLYSKLKISHNALWKCLCDRSTHGGKDCAWASFNSSLEMLLRVTCCVAWNITAQSVKLDTNLNNLSLHLSPYASRPTHHFTCRYLEEACGLKYVRSRVFSLPSSFINIRVTCGKRHIHMVYTSKHRMKNILNIYKLNTFI